MGYEIMGATEPFFRRISATPKSTNRCLCRFLEFSLPQFFSKFKTQDGSTEDQNRAPGRFHSIETSAIAEASAKRDRILKFTSWTETICSIGGVIVTIISFAQTSGGISVCSTIPLAKQTFQYSQYL